PSRQRPAASPAGPTSTTTAASGPVRSANASPWPTSHAASSQSAGIPWRAASRGTATTATSTTATAAATRTTGRPGGAWPVAPGAVPPCAGLRRPPRTAERAAARQDSGQPSPGGLRSTAHSASPVATASSSAPTGPAGQGTLAPQAEAHTRATAAIHPVAQPAAQATGPATAGSHGASTVATSPSTVAGTTAGAASRFAGTDTVDTDGSSSTS